VFCDHGAFNFADPRRLVPESARLLRGGGLLAFNVPSPLLDLFWDVEGDVVGDRLRNDYFGLHGFEDAETVEFQLPYGEWIRLIASSGFEIEDLIEIQAPDGATSSYDLVSAEWARRWPAENIWKARKPAG
jgi:SAM-dependent methyltransferase